jgi:RNA polymerase sigma-70 factor (ECF subfamily)
MIASVARRLYNQSVTRLFSNRSGFMSSGASLSRFVSGILSTEWEPMMDASFDNLIQGVRHGDADAATKLVREFEPEIRRVIRIHLRDSPLHRQFDSMDICQSVMANFLVRASAGQFDLDAPTKVLRLLVTMARNKLTDKARAHKGAARHPGGKQTEGSQVLNNVADSATSPSRVLQGRELLEQIKQQLTPEEAELLDYRAEGLEWPEIGVKLNAKPDGLRKKFTRAMDRVVENLNVESWLE